MNLRQMRKLLKDYLDPLPEGIEDNIQRYTDLLEKWGSKMPLTSIHDPEEIVRFHFGESIFALSSARAKWEGRLADVGTGAGFPGLAIKVAEPALSVALIEPNRKKCAFLHEVVRNLELKDVQIVPSEFKSSRIENSSVSIITCRALGRHDLVLKWAHEKLPAGGLILLWIGDDEAQEVRANDNWRWRLPLLIPRTRARFLLIGTKT